MPGPSTRGKRILIVDDEPTLVFFLMQGLRESERLYDVNSAANAEEALTKLALNQYDLLITDLKMPEVNGLTLIEVARSLQPDIKVILMTAYGSREVRDEVARLKVDGYLTKPFPTVKLRDMATNIFLARDQNSPNLATEQNLPSTVANDNQER